MTTERATNRQNRTETVGVRLTPAERSLVDAVARVDADGNRSAWARATLLQAARERFRELIEAPRSHVTTEGQPAPQAVT